MCLKCGSVSRRFQPEEGPSRGFSVIVKTGCGTDGALHSTLVSDISMLSHCSSWSLVRCMISDPIHFQINHGKLSTFETHFHLSVLCIQRNDTFTVPNP